jgi:hypothetical protein
VQEVIVIRAVQKGKNSHWLGKCECGRITKKHYHFVRHAESAIREHAQNKHPYARIVTLSPVRNS